MFNFTLDKKSLILKKKEENNNEVFIKCQR